MRKWIRILSGLIVTQLASIAAAQPQDGLAPAADSKLYWQFSPYTLHFRPSEDHSDVVMAGLERVHANGALDGVTVFSNSFGQPCAYIYPWGRVYPGVLGIRPLSFKWTAGVLVGYREPYENKVPLNFNGISPGAIVALSYEFKPGWSAQVDLLGTAGLMFQINLPFK